MILVRETAQGATFAVKVHPRARKTAVTGIFGEGPDAAVKVALSAPPVEGRANVALVEFFAEVFGVSRSSVTVISGAQSRNKVIRISGRAAADVEKELSVRLSN
jgi:uncharacterized protein (TIGR00251 family)